MTERDFIYWLNGFLEIANPNAITPHQTQIIKDHVALVLKKETPTRQISDIGEQLAWELSRPRTLSPLCSNSQVYQAEPGLVMPLNNASC